MNRYLLLVILFSVFHTATFLRGQAGYAINFQNANYMEHGDFIYCGSPDFSFTNEMTVAAWVKWTTDPNSFAVTPANHENEGQYSTYVACGYHGSNDINADSGQFWLRSAKTGNKFEFVVNTSSGLVTATGMTATPAANTWYFITGVYDGTNVSLYVNGNLEKQVSQTGNIRKNYGNFRLNLGKLPWGYGFFVGHMDDVRIWKKALTQSEIQQQMNSVSTIRSSDLCSYYNFNAGSGTTIDDSGPVNADGIFYSAAVDIHSTGTDFANKKIGDADKTWVVDYWAGMNLKTVAGAGVDETNVVVSNTSYVLTLQYGFGGTAPNNRTTPLMDSKSNPNDTWFGIEKTGETSQWVSSDAPSPIELASFTVSASSNRARLNWLTVSELNNQGFQIQRSAKDGDWQVIGYIPGAGNSNSRISYKYEDVVKIPGIYYYRLKQIDNDGQFSYSCSVEADLRSLMNSFQVSANYPNPFNPETIFHYSIPTETNVNITIYNQLGQKVTCLVNENKQPGEYEARFNSEEHGQLSGGVYYYVVKAGANQQTGKMVLIK